MAEDDKKFSKQMIGKTVVSKTGKRFGDVGDIIFETRSGELIHLVLANPTSYTEKLELENNAMNIILKKLPNELIDDYQNIWNEFLTCKTDESVFVHEMDKFEMAFQALQYQNKGSSKEKIQPFIESAKNEIKNKDLKEIISKIF